MPPHPSPPFPCRHRAARWLPAAAVALLGFARPPAAAADDSWMDRIEKDKARPAQLWLRNGDRVGGRLVSITPDGGIEWRHPAVPAGPIRFALPHADRVVFTDPPHLDPDDDARAVQVVMHNGDVLSGRLEAVTDEAVAVGTDFGASLRIRREAVSELGIGAAGRRTYMGPTPGEDWVAVQNMPLASLEADGLAFSANTGAALSLEGMPDAVRIEFDFAWDSMAHFMALLFLEDPQQMRGSSLWVRVMNSRTIQVTRRGQRGSQQVGQANMADGRVEPQGEVRLSILVDRPGGRFALLVDGEPVLEAADPELAGMTGPFLAFQYQHGSGRVHLRNFVVHAWSGPAARQAPEEEGADSIGFVNGETLSGRLLGVADGQARFESPLLDDLALPLERIRTVRLAGGAPEAAETGSTRVILAPYGRLTLAVNRLDEHGLEAHGAAGDVRIPLRHLRAIHFNTDATP